MTETKFGIIKDEPEEKDLTMGGLQMLMSFLMVICEKVNITPEEIVNLSHDAAKQKDFLKRLTAAQIKLTLEHVHDKN